MALRARRFSVASGKLIPEADYHQLYINHATGKLWQQLPDGSREEIGGGGTSDHAALTSNLAWTTSGHTGTTAARLAAFGADAAAVLWSIGTGLELDGSTLKTTTAPGDFVVDPGANGLVVRTALGSSAARTLTAPAAGFTITNDDGVAGNPTFVLAHDLAALEALSSTGYAVRTAANTWAQRTFTAGTGMAVTNGNGVSGNTSYALANMAEARVKGRASGAGTGAPTDLTATQLRALQGLATTDSPTLGGLVAEKAGTANGEAIKVHWIDDATLGSSQYFISFYGAGDVLRGGLAGTFSTGLQLTAAERLRILSLSASIIDVVQDGTQRWLIDASGGTLLKAPSGQEVKVGHDGDTTGKAVLTGAWATGSGTLDGLAGTRTTGGTYQTQTAIVRARGIVHISSVRWDVTAGTYTLEIDGVSHGTQNRGTTGSLDWAVDQVIMGAAVFKLTRSSSAAQVRDADAGPTHIGDLVILPNAFIYDTSEFSFRPAVRVTGTRVRLTDFVGLS